MNNIIYYTSGLRYCGVASYQGHVARYFDANMTCETITLTTDRTFAQNRGALAERRKIIRQLAAQSRGTAGVIVDYTESFFNGARPGENLFPLFLRHLARPPVIVLHEWPGRSDPPEATGSYLLRGIARVQNLTRAAWDGRTLALESTLRTRPFANAAHVVAHAQSLADASRIGLPRARVHYWPTPAYDPAPATWTPDEVDARFGLHGKRVVGLLGTPQASKGFDRAVAALGHLPSDVVLLQIGEVTRGVATAEALHRQAVGQGAGERYVRTGPLTDGELAGVLARVEVGCAPFRQVYHSSSLGHLIGSGVPVVASRVPGLIEVAEAGAGMMLVDCENTAALANALNAALTSACDDLRVAQRNYAQRHSFATVARRLVELATRGA